MSDWTKPVVTSTYTNYTSELDGRLDDLALGLDPATSSPTGMPTNSIRYSSASSRWEIWNGATWGILSSLYAINISGNAATATNGVVTTGSYSNPTWITALAWSKITGAPTTRAGYGITDVPTVTGTGASGTWSINVTGSAGSATSATNSTNVSTANEAADTTCFIAFVTAGSGNLPLKTRTNLTYNASTNIMSITDVTILSDETLKMDWIPFTPGVISRIAKAKRGSFGWRDSKQRQVGVSAQDWQKAVPEMVDKGADGKLRISQSGTLAIVAEMAAAMERMRYRHNLALVIACIVGGVLTILPWVVRQL